MIRRKFKRLFRAHVHANDGSPVALIWVGDQHHATLINPASGRVHAYVSHDGFGKYEPVLFVLPLRAIYLLRHQAGMLVSVLPFPRLGVELYRIKDTSMPEVQQVVEKLLAMSHG